MILLFDNAAACEKFSARFWAKIDKGGGPDTCWEWTGNRAKRRGGYGNVALGHSKKIRANRVAWLLSHGTLSDDESVLHKCDNPPCCNPAHLFLGTHQDNYDDMVAKGRANTARGEAAGRAKLTESQVRDIRRKYASGATLIGLGAEYGLTSGTVHSIIDRRSWKHVPDIDGVFKPGSRRPRKFTREQVLAIRSRYDSGERVSPLAAEYGVNYSAIEDIVKRRSYRHVQSEPVLDALDAKGAE